MRLLVTAANGQMGWELRRSLLPLGRVIATDRTTCDLSRPESLPRVIREVAPDIIVNAAAYTAVDEAEKEEQLATTVNGTAVGEIAEEARRRGILFLHYSTDYVFDGTKETPYTEEDPPCPINAYGRSKLVGERAIKQCGGHYLILRTSWIYAARGRNFLRTILALAPERAELRIVRDQIGAPNWAREIADVTAFIARLAQHELGQNCFTSGLLNLTATGETSWFDFARTIVEEATSIPGMLSRKPKVLPVTSADYPTRAVRPKNSRLAVDRLYERFRLTPPHWREPLNNCMAEIAFQRSRPERRNSVA